MLGVELSPYSVKVRSYLRYKKVPHKWVVRMPSRSGEFAKHAKLPIVPLLIRPDGSAMQDSTPIMDQLALEFPQPSAVPDDPVLAFLSRLLEEYADEWVNKPMFHYRWKAEADQNSASLRLAELRMPLVLRYIPIANSIIQAQIATEIKKRMTGRAWVIGSNEKTEARIEASFRNLLGLLEKHLKARPYLFGGKPSYSDFGLWGQIYSAWTDPTPRSIIETDYPGLKPWIQRMLNPSAEGEFESWSALRAGLMPILKEELGATFLPWVSAVLRALENGEDKLAVQLQGELFEHTVGGPQKYHAKSFAMLKAQFDAIEDREELDSILREADCLSFFRS